MRKANVIAIDGPAGSGKSTVAKEVARKLSFLYIDTGAMYRALTLKAMKKKINLQDRESLIKLSEKMRIELKNSKDSLKVYLDGKNVTNDIRTMEVTKKVKYIARIEEVRKNMAKLQRKLGLESSGAVLEGRDIGTVVFPYAKHKFYLDASFETRVKRRFDELKAKAMTASWEEVEDDVKNRDTSDMTRHAGPLKKASDAKLIDTTGFTVEQVVEKIFEIVKKRKIGSQKLY